jgi:hypothetical protein
MTIRSSASTQRWTNRETLDKEQDSRNNDSCRKGEKNDRFPARMWRGENSGGAPVIASSMNKSSSYSLPVKCYQKDEGLVSKSSRCIENTEPVLSRRRLSPDRRLFVVQLSQDTYATSDSYNPGEAYCA